MKKTVLALTTALLLAGGVATTASAHTYYYDHGTTYRYGDADRDGIPNRYDRYDNRNGQRGARYGYDRYGRRIVMSDRDCDGVADRYDRYIGNARDADCDGIPNRYDSAPRRYGGSYVVPYGYRGGRWDVGARLPYGYYGDSYYIDYQPYGLRSPPYGYRWNRVGNDAYLVSIESGLISEVVYDLFH